MPVTSAASAIKAGTVAHFAANSAPAGWLKANGAAISRSAYAGLFAAIGTTYGAGDGSTTFNLPDLRGEFVRGLDDGRGVDTGRAIGSAQGFQNGSHTHSTPEFRTGSGSSSLGVFVMDSLNALYANTTGSSGGTEARPRNVAMLACIKF